jgi:hypothetical protein
LFGCPYPIARDAAVATAAFATAAIESLNLISVAFGVMFGGLAVDFGIEAPSLGRLVNRSICAPRSRRGVPAPER